MGLQHWQRACSLALGEGLAKIDAGEKTEDEENRMRNEPDIKPAACAEYEALLQKSCVALTDWKNGRAEIRSSGRKGRKADDELRILQAKFAKAYAQLQTHARDCELCQMPALVHPGYGINPVVVNHPLHQ
jgi:hypothetical protein